MLSYLYLHIYVYFYLNSHSTSVQAEWPQLPVVPLFFKQLLCTEVLGANDHQSIVDMLLQARFKERMFDTSLSFSPFVPQLILSFNTQLNFDMGYFFPWCNCFVSANSTCDKQTGAYSLDCE